LWPSLNKLWGVPQKIEYHPEVDTGIHVMMALSIATQLSEDPVVRFGTLCHDLGKGETPPEEWPSHHGHEERGVPIIQDFCKRYHVPNQYRDLAVLVSRFHLHCHRVAELNPSTLLQTLERLDIFRQPVRFEQFLLCCEADARGRLGLESKAYPQADKMRKAAEIIRNVDIKSLIEAGFQGAELGKRIYEARLRALKKFLE
jgi:tRNA nucleotidyltransferase (CCA-adding enzyme)